MKSWNLAENQIRAAVDDLKCELQEKRELHREGIHRALIIALHTDCLWEKAK
jgi:hypothetical protein